MVIIPRILIVKIKTEKICFKKKMKIKNYSRSYIVLYPYQNRSCSVGFESIGYKNTVDNFDSPQSQEIMERIISSFRFS